MFKIKICGVKLKQDIDAVASAGADAIGLNFFERSVRFVDPRQGSTQQLSEFASTMGLTRIGVFVDATAEQIATIDHSVGLDAIQLHGNETTEFARRLINDGLIVIRAIKLPVINLTSDQIVDRCGPWIELGCHLLLDADAGPAHGGSGQCLDWEVVGRWAASQPATRWTLAGGLDASNVVQAIQLSQAHSVDTASGAEETRGTKSPARINDFVKASKRALCRE